MIEKGVVNLQTEYRLPEKGREKTAINRKRRRV